MNTLVYLSTGFFVFYTASEAFKIIKSYISEPTSKEYQPPEILVNEVFPFSFIPQNKSEYIEMNMDKFDDLAHAINDYEFCSEAVFSEMLLQKIRKILFEKTKPTEEEIRSCLWLLVNCLMKIGQNINEIFLKVFQIQDFFKFFKEKQIDITKANELYGLKNGNYNQNGIFNSEAFRYPIEIIYLNYVILGNIYSISLSNKKLNLSTNVHFLEGIPKKYLILMEEKMNQFSFTKSNLKIEKEIELVELDNFLNISLKFASSDNVSLITLSLATIGQFCSTVNDSGLYYLLSNENLKLKKILKNLILCENISVLQILGKLLFTIFIRDLKTMNEFISSNFINEIIQISIFNNQISLKLQYMSLLYLMMIMNDNLCKKMIKNPKINLLNHLCLCLENSNSNLNFTSLQLLYAISVHSSISIIKFTRNNSKVQLLELIRKFTFVPQKLFRYHSVLIWSYISKNDEYLDYLSKREQFLTILIQLIKEEIEIPIFLVSINILKRISLKKEVISN
eukprot:gene927-9835_t